jgi:hypothetical protein
MPHVGTTAAEQFKESLTRFGSAEQKLDPVVRGAMRLGLQSQLKESRGNSQQIS